MRNKFRTSILSCALALASLLAPLIESAHAQNIASGYTPTPIQLPFTFLSPNQVTNLANGWTNFTYVTNTTTLWNSSSNAFISTTNIVTNAVVAYATIDLRAERFMSLELDGQYGGAATGMLVVQVAPSISNIRFDTNRFWTFGSVSNGSLPFALITNIDATGVGYGRILSISNSDGGFYFTNQGLYQGYNPRNTTGK